jgi:aspartyl-tRNA(Asn)/glutamyl-tRNA(Gln) amidotransferase subunit C
MSITLDELKHLADLARLRLSEEEFAAMQSDLNRVLEHFERLRAMNLSGLDLTPHSVDVDNVWREDVPTAGINRADALSGAPEVQAGLFLVPTIIE